MEYKIFKHSSRDVKLFSVLLTNKFALFVAELLDFLAAPEPAFHFLFLLETKWFSKFLSFLFVSLFILFFADCMSVWTSSLFGL